MNLAATLHRPKPLARRRLLAASRSASAQVSARSSRYLITVDFESAAGEVAFAVGGGPTLEDAIASAREAIPAADWEVVRWNHVHGE